MSKFLWVALSIVSGFFAALQARINGELAHRLDDGYAAALISFGSGFLILFIGLLIFRQGRRGIGRVRDALRGGVLQWWQVLGGAAGAGLVLSQGLTVTALGVALFTIAVVAGQTVGGIVIDRFGLGPGGPRTLTGTRIVGSVILLAAVALSVSDKLGESFPPWMLLLPLVGGFVNGWQQAVNGHVRIAADSAYTATLFNFAVGALVLSLVFLGHSAATHFPRAFPGEWWLYIGGTIGICFIALASVAVAHMGVLMLGLCTITGQLLGSLMLDLVFPKAGTVVSPLTIAGILLALVAIVIVAAPRRLRRPTAIG